MNEAQTAAWNVYAARVNAIFRQQHKEFQAGDSVTGITIAPPTKEHVEIIQKAIDCAVRSAQLAIITRVLGSACGIIDAIDNSRTKSETVKMLRADVERVYDELHALKAEVEKPQPDDAVARGLREG
jgi:hypothetical protein